MIGGALAAAGRFEFQWIPFLIAFAVGMLYVYVFVPPPNVVLKYPSPFNAGKVVYKDQTENCYRYKSQPVKCPQGGENAANILPQPLDGMVAATSASGSPFEK